jgi:hypothetical protein
MRHARARGCLILSGRSLERGSEAHEFRAPRLAVAAKLQIRQQRSCDLHSSKGGFWGSCPKMGHSHSRECGRGMLGRRPTAARSLRLPAGDCSGPRAGSGARWLRGRAASRPLRRGPGGSGEPRGAALTPPGPPTGVTCRGSSLRRKAGRCGAWPRHGGRPAPAWRPSPGPDGCPERIAARQARARRSPCSGSACPGR